ncbi:SDR family NAD(P)-dependent oxidoreductase [Streptomyces scopuliridis]|uniref:SDR family NAD(P)-dependent oxidoreductase n=1 Tax=Streptomyces scopuliridis TaxID=452529 RepID=UPI00342D96B6
MPGEVNDQQVQVAVVGIAALTPGAADSDAFWQNVLSRRDLITDVPPSHWLVSDYFHPDADQEDRTYSRRGAFIPNIDFDPTAYGIAPHALPATDTAQLLALLVTDRALADVNRNSVSEMDRERVGVILGSGALNLLQTMSNRMQRPVWVKALREHGVAEPEVQAICDRIAGQYVPWQEATFPGLLGNVIAGRIANRFHLHGTNATVDAACASSLAAMSAAVNELARGTADAMISGGVDTLNDIVTYMCFSKTPALSPTGDCRPFSADADGTMLGEAVVMFVLKRLADAERDGDRVYAVIRGVGSSSDGGGGAVYAPVSSGQARALRRAYEAAGYGPESVELVEAHGTGTKAGDAAEFAALREVFGAAGGVGRQWCALGSAKSQMGHTKSSAGAVGMLKAVLALQHKVLPPTIKVDQPNPALDLPVSPFYLNTAARPWIARPGHPRRASVSSFGFGGTNFHVTLEEYEGGGVPLVRSAPTELLLFCAGSTDDLLARLDSVTTSTGTDLPVLAERLQREFDPAAPVRLSLVVRDRAHLAEHLRKLVAALQQDPAAPRTAPGMTYRCGAASPGRTAWLFPGQGSQYAGMGADLAMAFPVVRAAWDRAAGTWNASGQDLPIQDVVFPKPVFDPADRAAQDAMLTATAWAQPALAVQSVAVAALLGNLGLTPDCVAGHSFGELTALHAAGVLTESELVTAARKRGELMRDGASDGDPGAMLAVEAPAAEVAVMLAGRNENQRTLWIANENGPRQTVVSGYEAAVRETERDFAAAGIATRRLHTAAAFHTPLMAAAAESFRDFLSELPVTAPRCPVYGNADARPYPAEPDRVRERLARHLVEPVRFAAQVEAMYEAGVRTFIEVGAGSVLTGLVGSVLDGRPHIAVACDHRDRHGVTSLQEALGALAVSGVPVGWEAVWSPYDKFGARQNPKGRMAVSINGANYGSPYPPLGGSAAVPPPNPPTEELPVPEAPEEPHITDGWMAVFQEAQRHTAQAHSDFQTSMVDSHRMFMEAMTESLNALVGAKGSDVARPFTQIPPLPEQSPPPVATASAAVTDAVEIDHTEVPTPNVLVDPPAMRGPDVVEALIEVVAEKTGFPADVVDPHLEMETDLGIDSIKRVEVLAELRRRIPALASVDLDVTTLSSLRTIHQVADAFHTATDSPPEPPLHSTTSDEAPDVDVVRTAPILVAAPRPGLAVPGLHSGVVLVTDEGNGVAQRLVEILVGHGVNARVAGTGDLGAPEVRGLVVLDGFRPVGSVDEATAVNRTVFRTVRACAKQVGAPGGLLVTVQDTGGDFGLSGTQGVRAWLGGLPGLVRTLDKEWPGTHVKAIDCARADRDADALATALAEELLGGAAQRDVALSGDDSRAVLTEAPAPKSHPDPVAPRPDGVVVATGGGRGITAQSVLALAAAGRVGREVILFGRNELVPEPPGLADARTEEQLRARLAEIATAHGTPVVPSHIAREAARAAAVREIKATLDALTRLGTPARYLPVDVRDAAAVKAALGRVRAESGPVTGLVHGAGVLADGRLTDTSDQQFADVFETKVTGLRNVLDATANDPLDMVCVFSSAAGRFGNAGQSAYAIANEVVAQVASVVRTARPSCRVRSLAWGPWDAGMVTPQLRERFLRDGTALIPPDAGASAFMAEVTGADAPVRVTLMGGQGPDPFAGPPAEELLGAVVAGERSHPQLADHAPADRPVLPLALAIEWFLRASRVRWPDAAATSLRELEVVRRIEFDQERHLVVRGRPADADTLHLELTDTDGTTYIRALAVPGSGLPAPRLGSDGGGVGTPAPYGGPVLFHGPAFQAIEVVESLSTALASARVRGVRSLGWPEQPWQCDPAALDAGLQTALLWAAERGNGAAHLPMAVAETILWKPGPVGPGARCVVHGSRIDSLSAECDVTVLDSSGAFVARMAGVRLVRRPDQPVARAVVGSEADGER